MAGSVQFVSFSKYGSKTKHSSYLGAMGVNAGIAEMILAWESLHTYLASSCSKVCITWLMMPLISLPQWSQNLGMRNEDVLKLCWIPVFTLRLLTSSSSFSLQNKLNLCHTFSKINSFIKRQLHLIDSRILIVIFLHCPLAWINNIAVAPFVKSHFAPCTGETLQYWVQG